MPSETIKLTAKFKLKETPEGLDNLFSTYREIVNFLITYAFENNVTSFYRLKKETYKSLRKEYPKLPSHYLYTACQMATAIFKSYRKRKKKGKANGKPVFKKEVIMLDDHLFKLDLENKTVKLSTPNGRIQLEFYPAKYHKKFKGWKVGQAWLFRTPKGVFLNVVFSKEVEVREPKAFVGVDLNENNVTLSLPNGEFVQIITHEREIRTGYFVKRRRIQKKLKSGKRRKELLEKYGEREKNRLNDLYHKLANKIVELAEEYGGLALEDLTEIRDSIRYSVEMNGRLHRWSFRKLQSIIEYKAKLKGVKVVFVNPAFTSSLCPLCGGKLSPNGHRVLKCSNCGFEADRDVVGGWNIRLRALKMWGVTVPPEGQPMKTGGWKVSRNDIYKPKVTANQNGSGIGRILKALREYNLPEPRFEEVFGGFQVTFYRDVYTEERLRNLGLNHRQIRAVLYVKEKGSITNKEYQELFKVSRQTATRDLGNLVNLGIFERVEKGRYKLKTQHESNMSQKVKPMSDASQTVHVLLSSISTKAF